MSVTWRQYLWNEPHPASPDELASIERQWGVTLPDDYKTIISTHQGMSPRPNTFDVGRGENVIAALLLVSPDEQHRAYSIKDTYTQVKPHVPEGIYPFAVTGTGDYLCFDYRESAHVPKIVFYFTEDSGEEALYPIANDFSGLLARLHD
ncbi:MAG: SMI1/KNR4 family protein [Myxococcaceae bacterium]|nr:SMI1/KNR4 family protein [Myxococcaceae bacterium]